MTSTMNEEFPQAWNIWDSQQYKKQSATVQTVDAMIRTTDVLLQMQKMSQTWNQD
jgi:hypothetical protein